jgi:hypothetical protein
VITFNQDKEHKISLPLIYRKLRDYLLSECSDVQRYNPSIIYGINTWERFRQELKGLAGIDSYFDNRSFMVLTEHKQIMMLRVEYLIREGILSDVKILEQCRQVYEKALEAVEICTKYNKQRDFSQLGILDRILKEIVYIEKLYISIILENINSVYSVKSG